MSEQQPSTRPDVADRLRRRRTENEVVVKSTLRKYLAAREEDTRTAVLLNLTKRVDAFSKRANAASLHMSSLVKGFFYGVRNEELSDIDLPDLFDVTFVRQLFLGPDYANQPDPSILSYWELLEANDPLKHVDRFAGDRNVYCYGANMYATNFKNSLKFNLEARVKTFLKRLYDVRNGDSKGKSKEVITEEKEEKAAMLFDIMGWTRPVNLEAVLLDVESIGEVDWQRSLLDLANGERIDNLWLDASDNLLNILRLFVYHNRVYEAYDFNKFSIVPICSIRRHFMTIDTSTLYGIMKDVGAAQGNFEAFDALRNEQWKAFVSLDRLASGPKTFSHMIQTDGTSLCTHFKTPKSPEDMEASKKGKKKKQSSDVATIQDLGFDEERDRLVACDPGGNVIMSMIEKRNDGTWASYRLTKRTYYNDSGMFEARDCSERWQKGIGPALAGMTLVSIKGVDTVSHDAYMAAYLANYGVLWAEYTKKRWANQRLRLYGGKKRSYARFFNSIQQGRDEEDAKKRVFVAYGNARFDATGCNQLSTPVQRSYKECKARFPTADVDEYLTTKTDFETDQILKNVVARSRMSNGSIQVPKLQNGQTKVLRGLLWCDSTIDKKSKFVDRDLNAAKNIWRCAMEAERPIALRRPPPNERRAKIVMSIGRVITNKKLPRTGS